MGFGLVFLFIFIIAPLSLLWMIAGLFTFKRVYFRLLGMMWCGLALLLILSLGIGSFTRTRELSKEDYYGQYVINRNIFPGPQTDWQYNHFRFEIRSNDSVYFYQTEGEHIVRTWQGYITTVSPYGSARLVLHMPKPTHHILSSNPVTYRYRRDFYLVFESPVFYNVFFSKGRWEPLEPDSHQ